MQRDLSAYLQDIVQAGTDIQTFTAGISFEDYQASDPIRAAVEPKFSIIGEALNQALHLDPTLQNGVDDCILWSATKTSLSALMNEAEILLKAKSA